jgi:hypothetical protein
MWDDLGADRPIIPSVQGCSVLSIPEREGRVMIKRTYETHLEVGGYEYPIICEYYYHDDGMVEIISIIVRIEKGIADFPSLAKVQSDLEQQIQEDHVMLRIGMEADMAEAAYESKREQELLK